CRGPRHRRALRAQEARMSSAATSVLRPTPLGRKVRNSVFVGLAWTSFLVALVPLVSVLALVVEKGSKRFDLAFLTHSLRGVGPRDTYGGAYHAILGTLEQVGLASLISIPIGLLAAMYVVQHGRA